MLIQYTPPSYRAATYSFLDDEYSNWAPVVEMIRDFSIGEIAVKSRGTRYLAPLEQQTDDAYRRFLDRAVFVNFVSRTVGGLVGTLFAKPPEIRNIPDDYDLSSVSKHGLSFFNVARSVALEVVSVGRVGLLVDAPPEGGPSYVTTYQWEDLLSHSTRRINGREVLDSVTLREVYRRRDDENLGTTETCECLRILYLDENDVYRQRFIEGTDLQSLEYEIITPTINGREITGAIPFIFLNPIDLAPSIHKPPMLDIALVNQKHYATFALLASARIYSAFPIYVVQTDNPEEGGQFKYGPSTIWSMAVNDKASILDYKGEGLAGFERDLALLEQEMQNMGAKLVGSLRGTAAESSESATIKEKNEYNFLSNVSAVLSEGLTRVLQWLLMFDGRLTYRVDGDLMSYTDAHIKFVSTLDDKATAREIRAIQSLYQSGMIGIEALYGILKDAAILPPTVSLTEFRASLPAIPPQVRDDITKAVGIEAGKLEAQARFAPQQQIPQQRSQQVTTNG